MLSQIFFGRLEGCMSNFDQTAVLVSITKVTSSSIQTLFLARSGLIAFMTTLEEPLFPGELRAARDPENFNLFWPRSASFPLCVIFQFVSSSLVQSEPGTPPRQTCQFIKNDR